MFENVPQVSNYKDAQKSYRETLSKGHAKAFDAYYSFKRLTALWMSSPQNQSRRAPQRGDILIVKWDKNDKGRAFIAGILPEVALTENGFPITKDDTLDNGTQRVIYEFVDGGQQFNPKTMLMEKKPVDWSRGTSTWHSLEGLAEIKALPENERTSDQNRILKTHEKAITSRGIKSEPRKACWSENFQDHFAHCQKNAINPFDPSFKIDMTVPSEEEQMLEPQEENVKAASEEIPF